MAASGYALFVTPIGRCGVAWMPGGVAATSLPDAGAPAARVRLSKRAGGAHEAEPPEATACVIARICALLSGDAVDLGLVLLDDHETAFNRSVYAVARAIPSGETLTYGEVAARLGDPGLARAVGQGARPQSLAHHRPLPSRARRLGWDGRLLRAGRRDHQAAHALHRTRHDIARAAAVRRAAARRALRMAGAARCWRFREGALKGAP